MAQFRVICPVLTVWCAGTGGDMDGSDEPSATLWPVTRDLARVITSLTEAAGHTHGMLERRPAVVCSARLAHPELVAALVLVGPIVSGLDFHRAFHQPAAAAGSAVSLTAAQEIEYWSSTDPWWTAPANTGARRGSGAGNCLRLTPNNLRPKEHLENGRMNLPRCHDLGQIAVPHVDHRR